MKYKQSIQTAIDYIEENLKNDLNNVQIAESAGYSEYHFLRIFRECVGLTPADYIRKRRISEIVRCMEEELAGLYQTVYTAWKNAFDCKCVGDVSDPDIKRSMAEALEQARDAEEKALNCMEHL